MTEEEIVISIEILKFVQDGKTEEDILNEFGNHEGVRILQYLYTEDFVEEKDGKIYLNKKGKDNLEGLIKKNKKIKRKEFWKHPLVVGVLIAIITALLTAYITYKITIFSINEQKNLTLSSQEKVDKVTEFEQTYSKLMLSINIVEKQEIDCQNTTNKTELIINQQLLKNAKETFLKGDVNLSSYYLKQIEPCISYSKCVAGRVEEETKKGIYGIRTGTLIILVILILCVIGITFSVYKLKKKK